MASYTIRLNDVCRVFIRQNIEDLEEKYPDVDFDALTNPLMYSDVDEMIQYAWQYIFNFPFPIFDEPYREILCTKFIRQNWMREICCETIGQWKLQLGNRLQLIMPYYNQLYRSEQLQYNPLENHSHYETNAAQGTRDTTEDFTAHTSGSLHSTTIGTEHVDTGESGEYHKDGVTSDTGTENGKTDRNGSTQGTESRDTQESGTSSETGTTSGESQGSRTLDTTETTNSSGWEYFNDTPQGGVETLNDLSYLTSAKKSTGNATVTGKQTEKTTGSESGQSGKDGETSGESHTQGKTTGTSEEHETSERETKNDGTWGEDGTDTRTGTRDGRTTGQRDDTTTGDTKNATTGTIRTTDDYVKHYAGKSGIETYPEMVMKWRDSFLNIDMMVLRELDCLFMGLWQ